MFKRVLLVEQNGHGLIEISRATQLFRRRDRVIGDLQSILYRHAKYERSFFQGKFWLLGGLASMGWPFK